jgi:hypothetical protein
MLPGETTRAGEDFFEEREGAGGGRGGGGGVMREIGAPSLLSLLAIPTTISFVHRREKFDATAMLVKFIADEAERSGEGVSGVSSRLR